MTEPKPCGCPDTLQTPMTVAELRALLAEYSGDTVVWIRNAEFGELGSFKRPAPHRVRVMPHKALSGESWWRRDYDEIDPDGVEGIYL